MTIKKILAVSAAALALAGCKIEITVPEGGRVVTESGNIVCEAGETCTVDVVDIFFDELFIAEADEGMQFAGWQKRNRGFCGGSTDHCHLYTSGFEGNEDLMPFLESDEEKFYLSPTWEEAPAQSGDPVCDYEQVTPGGSFEVCETGHDENSCAAEGGTFSLGSCADRDPEPVGYCSTNGDANRTYYYDHNASLSGLETGCGFSGGDWVEL